MDGLTIKDLQEMNPSYQNPVILVCKDGYFQKDMKEISVVGVGITNFMYQDATGYSQTGQVDVLRHFEVKNTPPVIKDGEQPENIADKIFEQLKEINSNLINIENAIINSKV